MSAAVKESEPGFFARAYAGATKKAKENPLIAAPVAGAAGILVYDGVKAGVRAIKNYAQGRTKEKVTETVSTQAAGLIGKVVGFGRG